MQIYSNFSYLIKLAVWVCIASSSYSCSQDALIQRYNPVRHRSKVLDILHENWYWTIAVPKGEARQRHYSPEYRFNYLAPTDRPEDVGKLIVKICEDGDQVAGFITYYMKSVSQGIILVLAVDKAYRRQGCAKKLITYAVSDLQERGMKTVELAVRAENKPACVLYENIGFKKQGSIENRFGSFIMHQLDIE